MRSLGLLIVVLALVAFTAGTAARAAGSGTVARNMAMSADCPMYDCTGCPGESAKMTMCDFVCAAPVTIALTGAEFVQRMVQASRQRSPVGGTRLRGFSAPPDPFPPRGFL